MTLFYVAKTYQDPFTYNEAVGSGMVKVTRMPRENDWPAANKQTNPLEPDWNLGSERYSDI